MVEKLNKPEPKKIRMPPLVDRYNIDDTMDCHSETVGTTDENYSKNNSQSIQQLESDSTN